MYEILIGEISRSRKSKWDNGSTDPSSVISKILYSGSCTMGTLQDASKYFHDEIQVDWGCFAWKAHKCELLKFFRRKGYSIEELDSFDPFKEYAVVYIDR